jgi:D-glycero-D-manno-heptose 1,7-bisphosphate phosphatase
MKKVLFLDRDGVVNVDHGYTYRIADFEFVEGVFEACLAFQQAGYEIVVVTNQSGIGRGYYTEQDFWTLTNWMKDEFKKHGVTILDVYFCPHHPKNALPEFLKKCDCRKPAPGMLLQAISEHHIDPALSIMVGDKPSDMEAAIAAKIGQRYLVQSGQAFNEKQARTADKVYHSLPELAKGLQIFT